MNKKKLSYKKSTFETGKTLPNRVSSYSPSHRAPTAPPAELTTPKPKHIFRRIAVSICLVVLVAAAIIAIWDARNISSAEQKMFGTGNIFSLINSSPLKGADQDRVNVLLVGYSVDDPGHPAANLTDSIIILSLKPSAKTGYMLSVPRDLYADIPNYGYAKINEAYTAGGIESLKSVITKNFQIPIDYYVLVNYAAVRDSVNALGGITLNVQSQDPRGLFDNNISPVDGGPLKLANGPQSLNGQTALNFSRARGDSYDSYGFAQADFDRTQHQRQVLTAIKDKINWKIVLNPTKNGQLLNAAANNLKTDLRSSEARPMFGLFNSVPTAQLKSLSLRELDGVNYLNSYTTIYGQSALVPAAGLNDYSAIVKALAAYNQ
jgi:LCP family protein required for cell wall assembly